MATHAVPPCGPSLMACTRNVITQLEVVGPATDKGESPNEAFNKTARGDTVPTGTNYPYSYKADMGMLAEFCAYTPRRCGIYCVWVILDLRIHTRRNQPKYISILQIGARRQRQAWRSWLELYGAQQVENNPLKRIPCLGSCPQGMMGSI